MSSPYVGEIRMVGFNFAPQGWMLCTGQVLPISENETLFQLIGTTYGGDGQSTFALPDLRSRVPIHMGQGTGLTNRTIGETAGVETVTLTVNSTPNHSHIAQANSNSGNSDNPAGNVWAASSAVQFIAGASANASMNAGVIASTGGSQPHDNMLPYLAINFIISLFGIFPSP